MLGGGRCIGTVTKKETAQQVFRGSRATGQKREGQKDSIDASSGRIIGIRFTVSRGRSFNFVIVTRLVSISDIPPTPPLLPFALGFLFPSFAAASEFLSNSGDRVYVRGDDYYHYTPE